MNLEKPISEYKLSRVIAYFLSLSMAVITLSMWQNLAIVAWPIVIIFLLTLAFNGGLGGKTIIDRIPFYLAVSTFVLFLVLVFLSMM